jgi:hypothetical protein
MNLARCFAGNERTKARVDSSVTMWSTLLKRSNHRKRRAIEFGMVSRHDNGPGHLDHRLLNGADLRAQRCDQATLDIDGGDAQDCLVDAETPDRIGRHRPRPWSDSGRHIHRR